MFCAGLRCCLALNDPVQMKLLTQVCFFSLLPWERSHFQAPKQHRDAWKPFIPFWAFQKDSKSICHFG